MQTEIHPKGLLYTQQIVLKFHLDLLRSQTTYYLYFEYLRLKILPLIRLIYRDLVFPWLREKISYLNRCDQLKKDVLSEIIILYEELKRELVRESLLDSPIIKERCMALESILKFDAEDGRIWVMPAQYKIAFEHLKALCYAVARIKKELVAVYAESFSYITEYLDNHEANTTYQCNDCFKLIAKQALHAMGYSVDEGKSEPLCPKCGCHLQKQPNGIPHQVPHIRLFNKKTFVPSFFKLVNILESFSNSAAGAWDVLCSIEWSCDIDNREYFRKNLYHDNPKACERSVKLLNLNLVRKQVGAIKKKQEEKAYLLSREYIDSCLSIVTSKLYEKINIEEMPSMHGPEVIEIDFGFSVDLKLIITWAPGIQEICLMNSFQNEGDFRCRFFKDLLSNPGVFTCLTSGKLNAKKYLREAGIDKVLRDILLSNADKNGATLKNKRSELHQLPASRLEELRAYLQEKKFRTIGWR